VAKRALGADNAGVQPKEQAMIGFVVLGIVMLIWVLTWESTESKI
jgi:hypothetical protein